MNWQIVLDVAIVAFILITVIKNAKNGFIKIFLQSLKSLAIFLLALVLTPMLVSVAKDNFVNGWFEGTITTPFVETAEQAGENFNMETIMSNLPEEAKPVMSMIDVDGLMTSFEGNGVELAKELGGRIEGLIINIVANVITFVAIYIVLFIVLSIVFKIIEKSVKLPILKQGDHILGFLWGVVSAYISTSLLLAIIPLIFGGEFLEGTYVSRYLYEYGLFTFLLNKIL